MASQIIGRTPSGQLPTAYWDRKMQSDMSRSGDTRTQLFVGNVGSALKKIWFALSSSLWLCSSPFELDGKILRTSLDAVAPSSEQT